MSSWQERNSNSYLTPVVKATDMDNLPAACDVAFDWDNILTLEDIREHTKTDDIPSVTDRQLARYRRAAVESAEQYTGMLLSGQKTITENVEAPSSIRARRRGHYTHELQYPTADGIIHLYGSKSGGGNATLQVAPGTREIKVPLVHDFIDISPCCGGPCDRHPMNYDMKVMYKAGFKDCSCIPAGVILGMLKFIAWSIKNPGDEIMTVRNRLSGEAGTIVGTNNVAWASGALELWRQYDYTAI